ncbi:MAG: MBL fold metallo-hydrolase [Chloroflexi bacterium]|nr:MBL fold metallo-hydrolase [Chloroflexota bacterium]
MNENKSISTKTAGMTRKLILTAALIGLAFVGYRLIFPGRFSPSENISTSGSADFTAQLSPGSMEVNWVSGSADCANSDAPAIQVHQYNSTTYILRQSPCADFEAPFMYLLIGETRAFLLDSGAVADEAVAPVAPTVMDILAELGQPRLPLIVAHSHGHFDHRSGDDQFFGYNDVVIVGDDQAAVQKFFGLNNWPEGIASLDLGGRSLEILPIPGHHPAGIAVYDTLTGLLLTGDNLLPGRVYIYDLDSFRSSSERLVEFIENRPVSHVLGGHLEMDNEGKLYETSSTFRPNQRGLQMTRENILELDQALNDFGPFSLFSTHDEFLLVNNGLILTGMGIIIVAFVGALALFGIRFIRRRRSRAVPA